MSAIEAAAPIHTPFSTPGPYDHLPVAVFATPGPNDPSLDASEIEDKTRRVAMPIMNYLEGVLTGSAKRSAADIVVTFFAFPMYTFLWIVDVVIFNLFMDRGYIPNAEREGDGENGKLPIAVFNREIATLHGHLDALIDVANDQTNADLGKLQRAMKKVADFLELFSDKTTDSDQLIKILWIVKEKLERKLVEGKKVLFQDCGGTVSALMKECLLFGYFKDGPTPIEAERVDLEQWKECNRDFYMNGLFSDEIRDKFRDQLIEGSLPQSFNQEIVALKMKCFCAVVVPAKDVDASNRACMERYEKRRQKSPLIKG